jgi:hypothetical protein
MSRPPGRRGGHGARPQAKTTSRPDSPSSSASWQPVWPLPTTRTLPGGRAVGLRSSWASSTSTSCGNPPATSAGGAADRRPCTPRPMPPPAGRPRCQAGTRRRVRVRGCPQRRLAHRCTKARRVALQVSDDLVAGTKPSGSSPASGRRAGSWSSSAPSSPPARPGPRRPPPPGTRWALRPARSLRCLVTSRGRLDGAARRPAPKGQHLNPDPGGGTAPRAWRPARRGWLSASRQADARPGRRGVSSWEAPAPARVNPAPGSPRRARRRPTRALQDPSGRRPPDR